MADILVGTYYCVINDGNWEFPEGIYCIKHANHYTTKILRCISQIYCIKHANHYTTKILRCISQSDITWFQGPKGGVKPLKHDFWDHVYQTKNPHAMQEFMWVKLQAQQLANYT